MKKFFALMLATLMLVSCFAIGVAAEEEQVNRVIITDGSDLAGWAGEGGSGIPEPVLNETLDDYPVVSFTYAGEIFNEGGWKNPNGDGAKPTNGVKIHYRVAKTDVEAYDLTGMSYLIFDLYVSDPAMVEGVTFWLELTSSGTQDKEERNWRKTLTEYVGGEVVAGWNRIELDLSSTTSDSGFNVANWNFMRIFNSQGFNAGEGFTLAFKNVYFSTTSPKAEQAKAAAVAVTELFAPIADISSGDITAENYETVKAQLAAAVEAYIAADTATQAAAEATYDIGKIERSVTRALEKYEEELNKPAEPETPAEPDAPAEPTTPDVPDEPATPDEPTTPDEPITPDAPAEEGGLNPVIIAVVAVVVVAAVVVVIVIIKKKKQ